MPRNPRKVTVEDIMNAEGFYLVHTGGNCTAYRSAAGSSDEERFSLTARNEPACPVSMRHPVTFAVTDDDRKVYVRDFDSVALWWHWYSTTDYILPWNGNGTESENIAASGFREVDA
ncbi:hypothetical protein [Caudoviricetes sp.]|nr:hypothetical protein [Caudoviricetes sp.]